MVNERSESFFSREQRSEKKNWARKITLQLSQIKAKLRLKDTEKQIEIAPECLIW